MKTRLSVLIAALSLAAHPAWAQPAAAPEQPHWNVDGAGKQCILSRGADTPAGATLALRTYPWSGMVDLVLVGPHWPAALHADDADLTLKFSAPDDTLTHKATVMALQGAGQAIIAYRLGQDFFRDLARAKSLDFAFRGAPLATVSLPMGDKAIQALRYCERAKLVEWGADQTLLDPASQPPEPSEDTDHWVDMRAFHDFHALANYTFRFFSVARLTIADDGKIEKCDTLDTLGERQVDRFVCDQLTAHAHYRAAHDRDGKAVRGIAILPYDMVIKSTLTAE